MLHLLRQSIMKSCFFSSSCTRTRSIWQALISDRGWFGILQGPCSQSLWHYPYQVLIQFHALWVQYILLECVHVCVRVLCKWECSPNDCFVCFPDSSSCAGHSTLQLTRRQNSSITVCSGMRVQPCIWHLLSLQVSQQTLSLSFLSLTQKTHSYSFDFLFSLATAGITTTTATSPIWVVKTQIQLDTRWAGGPEIVAIVEWSDNGRLRIQLCFPCSS